MPNKDLKIFWIPVSYPKKELISGHFSSKASPRAIYILVPWIPNGVIMDSESPYDKLSIGGDYALEGIFILRIPRYKNGSLSPPRNT